MTTSDLLLVTKYGEFCTFFPQTNPLYTFLALHWSSFFVTTVQQFQQEEGKQKTHTHHHTLQ
jgi:hypothetical protein